MIVLTFHDSELVGIFAVLCVILCIILTPSASILYYRHHVKCIPNLMSHLTVMLLVVIIVSGLQC
jgi:hypothetical protein